MAKNLVAAGFADKVEVQMAYAIGVAEPLSIYVNTFRTAKVKISDAALADKLREIFDLRPGAIEKRLGLRNPIYEETAAYGHMGRTPRVVTKRFESPYENPVEKDVELFTWEKLDYVDRIKKEFGL
jgi:S-adenosylmethionine synthetase